MAFTGVFPVHNLKFKIGTKVEISTEGDMAVIADMETFYLYLLMEQWKSGQQWIQQEGLER